MFGLGCNYMGLAMVYDVGYERKRMFAYYTFFYSFTFLPLCVIMFYIYDSMKLIFVNLI